MLSKFHFGKSEDFETCDPWCISWLLIGVTKWKMTQSLHFAQVRRLGSCGEFSCDRKSAVFGSYVFSMQEARLFGGEDINFHIGSHLCISWPIADINTIAKFNSWLTIRKDILWWRTGET